MTKQIKIRIYPDGRIESETVNIKGKSCLGYIKEIEHLTDAKTYHSEFKAEYYQSEMQTSVNNEVQEFEQN